jgi:hypothetical protein
VLAAAAARTGSCHGGKSSSVRSSLIVGVDTFPQQPYSILNLALHWPTGPDTRHLMRLPAATVTVVVQRRRSFWSHGPTAAASCALMSVSQVSVTRQKLHYRCTWLQWLHSDNSTVHGASPPAAASITFKSSNCLRRDCSQWSHSGDCTSLCGGTVMLCHRIPCPAPVRCLPRR